MADLRVVRRWQEAAPATFAGATAVVIDVLRWSTVVVTALDNGAERVESFGTPAAAFARAGQLGRDRVLLGGERGNVALEGFDVGNSPGEYAAARVSGRTVLTTTTNGTGALLAAAGAHEVVIASFRNLAAVTGHLRGALGAGRAVVFVPAGQEGREALEDLGCAGALIDALAGDSADRATQLDAGAQAARERWTRAGRDVERILDQAPHAATLRAAGFGADVEFCARRDASVAVPVLSSPGIRLCHKEI
jgi:2-phosphosulfolactate phosphatase